MRSSAPSVVEVSTPPPRRDFGSWNHFGGRVTPGLDVPVPEREGQLGDRGDRDSERKRLEEVSLIEADRLGDELAERPALGRQRGGAGLGSTRRRRRAPAPGH